MPELHISSRLKKLLPPLTAEERQQLKANIEADCRVTDPIFYWHDGKKNVVVDGMNRWELVRNTDFPYDAQELELESYEDAELWILNHQLGRRNLLKPAAVRKLRGDLYNRLKTNHGGHRKGSTGQNVLLIGDASQEVAKKAGVSARTVRRDGIRAANIDKLTKAAKVIADKASDKDIKELASCEPADQDAVARAVRTGQSATVGDAIRQTGARPKTRQRARGGSRKGKSKPKNTAASLVDSLVKKHIGQIARALTAIAEANGGEGAQFKAADDGLNQLITALKEMRKGHQ